MKTPDLNDRFLSALKSNLSQKEIIRQAVDMLGLSSDAAYRRVSGKVPFDPREIGILCKNMGISLDRLLRKDDEDIVLMPFVLGLPHSARSIDDALDIIDLILEGVGNITSNDSGGSEYGGVYTTLPLEFFIHSPVLTKFMFFRWGYNFVGSEEFRDYSKWPLPVKLAGLSERIKSAYKFDSVYYLWDAALIWSFVRELDNFHLMHIVTSEEKNEIRDALKELLVTIEKALDGTYVPAYPTEDIAFYVSNIDLGFTNVYVNSAKKHLVVFMNNFSFSMIDNHEESFIKLKNWSASFRSLSKQLSSAGRIERKVFFDGQHRIIDQFLG